MKPTATLSLIALGSLLAATTGYLLAPQNPPAEPTPAEPTSAEIPAEPVAPPNPRDLPIPSFTFAQPFDARAELDHALATELDSERLGRLMAIGYHAAQGNPLENLESLSPELWDYANYDLRGAFLAEWMRSSPETFLPWAETKYPELQKSRQTRLFSSFHLAYLEPHALLQLLPQVENQKLKNDLRYALLGTLIEVDPTLLWQNREIIATHTEIINEAASKGLAELALQIWEWTDYEAIDFDHTLYAYMGENERLDLAAHLQDYRKTNFLAAYAKAHPAAAANWIQTQPAFPDIEHEFSPDHTAFFQKLLTHPDFAKLPDAPLWFCEAINSDMEGHLHSSLFACLSRNPDTLNTYQVQEYFRQSLYSVPQPDELKRFYLSLENGHPILPVIESVMLNEKEIYAEALASRAVRETPTPDRILQVLQYGNVEKWPDTYRQAALNTLESLDDEQLLWSLSPEMVLAATQIDPQRLTRLLAQADPDWLETTLNNPSFFNNATIQTLDLLPSLLANMPSEKAEYLQDQARQNAFFHAYQSDDKVPYVTIAAKSNEALLVGNSIQLQDFKSNPSLRDAINQHPLRDDFYLSLASDSDETEFTDPNLQRAALRLQQGRALFQQEGPAIAATFAALPDSEKLAVAKAALIVDQFNGPNPAANQILELPIWSDAERKDLYQIGFKSFINSNLEYHSDFDW